MKVRVDKRNPWNKPTSLIILTCGIMLIKVGMVMVPVVLYTSIITWPHFKCLLKPLRIIFLAHSMSLLDGAMCSILSFILWLIRLRSVLTIYVEFANSDWLPISAAWVVRTIRRWLLLSGSKFSLFRIQFMAGLALWLPTLHCLCRRNRLPCEQNKYCPSKCQFRL